MLGTTWNAVDASAEEKPKMPEPAIPIASSLGIKNEQSFDAMALIQEVSRTQNGGKTQAGTARVRCEVLLNDGSLDKDTNKVRHMPVTIFADATKDGQEPRPP